LLNIDRTMKHAGSAGIKVDNALDCQVPIDRPSALPMQVRLPRQDAFVVFQRLAGVDVAIVNVVEVQVIAMRAGPRFHI